MWYVPCKTKLRTAFVTAPLTSSLHNMMDVAKSDVWSHWTTLGARFVRRAIFGIVRRFPGSADCRSPCRCAPPLAGYRIHCQELCSLDQPNHSFQAYVVSIEEVNVVGNTACKIRTVATVPRSMLTSIRADAVRYSNCGVPESPAEVACQSPAKKVASYGS